MTRFIWVRDKDKVDHYINVRHIQRVTKVPAQGNYHSSAFIMMNHGREISRSTETYDTADEVIAKIQMAMA